MKVFDNNNSRSVESYKNESRFCHLQNENIVQFSGYGNRINDPESDKYIDASYILMELAFYGDFSDIIKIHHILRDVKLVRTYFHQLIQGIEYLHS